MKKNGKDYKATKIQLYLELYPLYSHLFARVIMPITYIKVKGTLSKYHDHNEAIKYP